MDHQSKKEIKIRSSTYLDKKKCYESQIDDCFASFIAAQDTQAQIGLSMRYV